MKEKLLKLLVKWMGYDDYMLYNFNDKWKFTKRYSNGREEPILSTNDKFQHVNLYRNNIYETSLQI